MQDCRGQERQIKQFTAFVGGRDVTKGSGSERVDVRIICKRENRFISLATLFGVSGATWGWRRGAEETQGSLARVVELPERNQLLLGSLCFQRSNGGEEGEGFSGCAEPSLSGAMARRPGRQAEQSRHLK